MTDDQQRHPTDGDENRLLVALVSPDNGLPLERVLSSVRAVYAGLSHSVDFIDMCRYYQEHPLESDASKICHGLQAQLVEIDETLAGLESFLHDHQGRKRLGDAF